ncbi:hypothetical protein [Bradyrhizobium sp. DASA03120]|uniref:hypothetical protein n=1 Tax=Bradyrhizobium sp. SMVTL-02 TaxID=3395917 RepID=UPI003F6EBAFB
MSADSCPQNGGIPNSPLFQLAASMPSAGTAETAPDTASLRLKSSIEYSLTPPPVIARVVSDCDCTYRLIRKQQTLETENGIAKALAMLRMRSEGLCNDNAPILGGRNMWRALFYSRPVTGNESSCYYSCYMAVRAVSVLFVLSLLLTVAGLGALRGVGSPSASEYTPSAPTSSAQREAPPQNLANKQHTSLTGVSVSIDSSSLVTDSANPVLTGTAQGITQIGLVISKGKSIPAKQYEGPGSVRNQVWGYDSGNPGFIFSDGHWSASVDYRVHQPVLQQGVYTVAIYGHSYLLTYDYLTVQR